MMRTRLGLGAMSLLVSLMALPACDGIQPIATPDERPIEIVVEETIIATDEVQVLPPVVISVGETVTATDEVQVLPPSEVTRTLAATPTPPDLAIEKLLNSEFYYGQSGSYTFRTSNVGSGTASSPITVVDVLPDGFTFGAYSDPYSTDWACSASGQQVTCTYTGLDISPGGFLPTLIITVTINPVDQFPEVSNAVDNCAEVQHPVDVNPDNNESCVTTVITSSGAAA